MSVPNGYAVLTLEHVLPNRVKEIKHWNIEQRQDIPSSVKIQDALFEFFKIDADDFQFRLMKQQIADLESSNRMLQAENQRLRTEAQQY